MQTNSLLTTNNGSLTTPTSIPTQIPTTAHSSPQFTPVDAPPRLDAQALDDLSLPASSSSTLSNVGELNSRHEEQLDSSFTTLRWADVKIEDLCSFLESSSQLDGPNLAMVKQFFAEYALGSIEINTINTDEQVEQRIANCAQLLGVRVCGLKYVLQKSKCYKEFQDLYHFEKNYCSVHKFKYQLRVLVNLHQKVSTHLNKYLTGFTAEEDKPLLQVAEDITKKKIFDQITAIRQAVESLEKKSKDIDIFNQVFSKKIALYLQELNISDTGITDANFTLEKAQNQLRQELSADALKEKKPLRFSLLVTILALSESDITKDLSALDISKQFSNTMDYLSENSVNVMNQTYMASLFTYYQLYEQFFEYFQKEGLLAQIPAAILTFLDIVRSSSKGFSDLLIPPYAKGSSEILKIYSAEAFASAKSVRSEHEKYHQLVMNKLLAWLKNKFQNKHNKFFTLRDAETSKKCTRLDIHYKKLDELAAKYTSTDVVCETFFSKVFLPYLDSQHELLSRDNSGVVTKKIAQKYQRNISNTGKKLTIDTTNNHSLITEKNSPQEVQRLELLSFDDAFKVRFKSLNEQITKASHDAFDLNKDVWVNSSLDKKIKAFVRESKHASYIVPPSNESGIIALKNIALNNNVVPLLEFVTIYPSRELGSGETIDQHLSRRHPEFFRDICSAEQSQVDNINQIGRVILDVLSSIEKADINAESVYTPEVGVAITFPILTVEGYHNGRLIRIILSKPFNKLLGLSPFESNKCLVARSVYPVDITSCNSRTG